MRTDRTLLVVLCLSIQTAAAVAANPGPAYQVADIAENTPIQNQGGIVLPGYFQPVADGDVFLAPAGTGSASVWRTDGSPEGTRPFISGPSIGYAEMIGSNGELAYFTGMSEDYTRAVWATDGTAEGTVFLQGGLFAPYDPSYEVPGARVVDGRLFFHSCMPWPEYDCELWTSGGTVVGTGKLVDLGSHARGLSGSAGWFYFLASLPGEFQPWLWRTDGTAQGTVPLQQFTDDGGSLDVASIGGEALVVAEGTLWLTEGDSVEFVATLEDGYASFLEATTVGGSLYFLVQPANGGDVLTVWRSDGTSHGTFAVLQSPLQNVPSTPDRWVQQLGSRIYYLIPGPQGREPYALWSSDAGGQGAQVVSCGGCASIPGPGWILAAAGKLYFPAAEGDAHTLWAIDSSHTAQPLKTYCTGNCWTDPAVAFADGAMFSVDPNLGGGELWTTDGSSAGTRSLGSFDPLYNLYASTTTDGVLFAAATEWPQETSLWLSRGAPGDAEQLTPVVGEGSHPRELRRAGERVAFLACREPQGVWGAGALEAELLMEGGVDCSSTTVFYPLVSAGNSAFFGYSLHSGFSEVWATDGTAGSTRKVWDHGSDEGSAVYDMAEWNSDLAFWGARMVGSERITSLWLSDGTAAGTSKAFDLPLDAGPPYSSTVLGDEMYFRSQSPDLQIWRTRGTAGTTVTLTDEPLYEFVWEPEFTRVGAFVYFTGRQGIWRTNGTVAGTTLLIPGPVDEDPYGADRLSFLHEHGGNLFYMRTEDGLVTLWRTEGSSGSTQQLASFREFASGPRSAATLGGYLFFAADDGVHGLELWRTDGSAAGTVLVRDIGAGPTMGNPRELVVAAGKLYFTAEEMFSGSELWVSGGSTGGTRRVQEIAPFAASSAPADLTVVGDLLYFSADDATTGRELWALPLTSQPTACTTGDAQLCLNDGKFRIEVSWRDFAGNTGSGHALPLSDDTGYFWFFDESIVELVVKVLDGRGINGHYWVYYASLSNVEFDVTITDMETNEFKSYHNPSGTFASVGDIEAFPTGGFTFGHTDRLRTNPRGTSSASESLGTCVPSSTRLCLQGGRFAVEAEWTDFTGNSGTGLAVPLSADTGYFWFFSPSVVEVVAKVVDGRPINGKFWVFYGALSNVEYTLTVTDTVTGATKPYFNQSGQFASVGDITAF